NQIRRDRLRPLVQCPGIEHVHRLSGSVDVGISQAVRECRDGVDLTRRRQASSALTECGEDRHSPADDALHVDFGSGIALETDHERWSGHVLETRVFYPELVRRSFL